LYWHRELSIGVGYILDGSLSRFFSGLNSSRAVLNINERLITEAKSLIQFTDFDIAEIAYQLNFSDPANFGKFFKKHTDKTPLEFRKAGS
jgi:AraC-like DNA-binding protein